MPEPQDIWRRAWGGATAALHRARRFNWIDALVVVGLGGILYAVIDLASEWTAPHRATVEINLSPWALPGYTLISLARGLLAYCISLIFTLLYGYWAAKDRVAGRVLIPLLDILQSIPVLAFLPGVLFALSALFPNSNIGLELAAVLLIFTGQAWNMTFSYYHSLRSVPQDQQDAATSYRFTWWQRLKWVELPYSTMGLVWNSMMSMAGGWFFLMICETYKLGPDHDFRRPGLGSYMQKAQAEGHVDAMVWAVTAMLLMIVALDQLLWRPVVVWSQKFRVEEGGEQPEMNSWFLNWVRRSRIITYFSEFLGQKLRRDYPPQPAHHIPAKQKAASKHAWASAISLAAFAVLLTVLGYGSWKLLGLLRQVPLAQWGTTLVAAILTLARVLASTALGTMWAVPAGLAIGLSPRMSRIFQPIVQVAASFPAPMLFPIVVALLEVMGVSLDWGCIALMLLGTQWYILFNVIAGAMAIPADLREASRSYRFSRWQRFRTLYLPAVFPYLVTGWVTAAGGAWNTSIVAEYFEMGNGTVLQARGLGGMISEATKAENFPLEAVSVLVMATMVVVFNRTVWRRLYELAERRYSLSK
jgi:NitT/TauT family transport system permease protein